MKNSSPELINKVCPWCGEKFEAGEKLTGFSCRFKSADLFVWFHPGCGSKFEKSKKILVWSGTKYEIKENI